DLLHISALQLKASSIKQGDLSVTDFFTQLRIIWDELENFLPDLVCTCNVKCFCKVSSTLAQRKLENQAMQFLCGLNEQYANEQKLTVIDPFTTKTRHGSINVVGANSNCNFCGRSRHTENTCYRKHGFPSNSDNKSMSQRGKTCTRYGKIGHTIDVCYKKHGFPLDIVFLTANLHLLIAL
ncbi:hypothetical protein V8G54_013673, partial [Vigna mungo]